jgi:hypothetical protein
MNIEVVKFNDSKIIVHMEYFPEAVSKIKRLGKVTWESAMKGWLVDKNFEDDAKDILTEYYGTDGSFRPKTVSIEITAIEEIETLKKPVLFAGKVIAAAYSRDSGASLGECVAQQSGKINSAGSAANWKTTVEEGSCFKVLYVNEELLKRESHNLFSYKVLESQKTNGLNRLRKISDEELIQECISRNLVINGN